VSNICVRVHHAQLIERPDDHYWALSTEAFRHGEDPPALGMAMIAPRWYLESIAAELEIDPDDRDTLLDVALYRPELPDHPGWDDGDWLYGAPSITHARESHLALIRQVKGEHGRAIGVPGVTPERRRVTPQPWSRVLLDSDDHGDPLDVIKEHSPISAEHLKVRREHRDMIRGIHRARKRAMATQQTAAATVDLSARQSAEDLRTQLLGPQLYRPGQVLG
jgi:hypothetical protein